MIQERAEQRRSTGMRAASRVPVPASRVLVLDGDSSIRRLCRVSLERVGVEVLEAEDGQRRLELALTRLPDLVLLEVRMGGLNCFELAEKLRGLETTRSIPIVNRTSESAPANRERARILGARACVTKPSNRVAPASLPAPLATPSENGVGVHQ
jgi:CheY-like chemotaxis protein